LLIFGGEPALGEPGFRRSFVLAHVAAAYVHQRIIALLRILDEISPGESGLRIIADGFPGDLRRELAQELDDIASVLDEAYRVLRDDRLRQTYLANLIE